MYLQNITQQANNWLDTYLLYRAVDEASTLKQPSLHMSAAAASRDITLFHAMDLLHASGYDFARGALALVDRGAPRFGARIGN